MAKVKGITATAKKDKRAKTLILVATLLLTAVFAALAIVTSPLIGGGSSRKIKGSLSTGSNTVSVSGDEEVYYEFRCSSGGTYIFTSSANSSYDPKATLYDSSWYSLKSDDDGGNGNNFSLSYSLTSGDTYYLGVKLSSGSSSSGSVSFNVSVTSGSSSGSDSSDKTTNDTLYLGSNSLTLNGSSEVYYSFRPSSSGTYIFTSSSSNSSLDPRATLYSSSWSSLKSDDDGGDGNNFSLSYSLNSGNTYYLGVQLVSGSSSGRTLTVNVSSGSSSSDKTVSGSLSTSSSTSVTLSGSKEVYYSFRPNSSGSYTFTCTGATSSVYPVATLYNSSWSQLQTSTNSSSNRNFTLTYSLTSGTTYYIGIKFSSSSSTSSKTFTVSVSR